MAELAIGIGLFINLFSFEIFGLSAGGMVVPGYIALSINEPIAVLLTISVSICTFLILQFFGQFMVIYGRRSLVLSILLGFIIGQIANNLFHLRVFTTYAHISVIGYIVPGITAYWMDRQGVIRTIAMMLIGAVITRLLLIIVLGGNLSL